MKIKEIQKIVDIWIIEYGVRYFDEKTNTLLLMEEVGEFAKLISRTYGEQSFKEGENIKEDAIAEEWADIFFVMICLANQMNLNIEDAITKSLIKKTNRDYLRHKQNSKLK